MNLLGEEVIGEGRDAIVHVLEISILPYLKSNKFFLLYSVQLENIMEVHSVMDYENFSMREVDLCRGYMLGIS